MSGMVTSKVVGCLIGELQSYGDEHARWKLTEVYECMYCAALVANLKAHHAAMHPEESGVECQACGHVHAERPSKCEVCNAVLHQKSVRGSEEKEAKTRQEKAARDEVVAEHLYNILDCWWSGRERFVAEYMRVHSRAMGNLVGYDPKDPGR